MFVVLTNKNGWLNFQVFSNGGTLQVAAEEYQIKSTESVKIMIIQ